MAKVGLACTSTTSVGIGGSETKRGRHCQDSSQETEPPTRGTTHGFRPARVRQRALKMNLSKRALNSRGRRIPGGGRSAKGGKKLLELTMY